MIIKSKILVKILSFNFAKAMALFPIILINHEYLRNDKFVINHEKIHIRQQAELLVIIFYVFYFLEYIFRRIQYKTHLKAYENISFEREAYANEKDLDYLKNRKFWSFMKYF